MDVSEGVEVLVLMQQLVRALLTECVCRIHQDDLSLALFILLLELLVLAPLVFDSIDKLSLHFWLTWQITDSFTKLLIHIVFFHVP